MLYGELRKYLGEVFHSLAKQKESKIEKGHLMADHVHMLISIPPKLAVAKVIGYLKGKSAIYVARHFFGKQRNYTGELFWARGYLASMVGYEEEIIIKYIREQEKEDQRLDQLELFDTLGGSLTNRFERFTIQASSFNWWY